MQSGIEKAWSGGVRGRAAIVAAAGLVIAGLLIVGDIGVSWGRIHPGVAVGDVAVGSMRPSEARQVLSAAFERRSGSPVTVLFEDREWTLTAAETGARLDVEKAVASAMAVGRTGGLDSMIGQRLSALLRPPLSISAAVVPTGRGLDTALARIAHDVREPSRDATIQVKSGDLRLVPSSTGRTLDRRRSRERILAAFMTKGRTVRAVTAPEIPRITDEEARRALEDAERMSSAGVTVVFKGKDHRVSVGTVAGWIGFERRSPIGTKVIAEGLVAAFVPERMAATVASFADGVERPARDARFIAGSGKVTIRPSVTGIGPDLAALADDLRRSCLEGGSRTATLRVTETQPSLTTEAAEAMGVKERISVYTTTYSSSNQARVSNVHTLAKALDGELLPPDGVFSFNEAAGERTAAKGYQEAPAIVNGKLVPQLGGGVCQVGTTVFNAVFFGGFPVVERRNHSFYVSHYPRGRDATVSWGGPDLKFRNDTGHWVLIRTAVTGTSLTVALYGTDPGYKVRYTTSAITDVVPHSVTVVKDASLASGKRKVEDEGVDGGKVTVTRTVYKGDTVVRRDVFVSHYRQKTEVVRLGTRVSESTTTVTPTGP